MKVDLVVSLDTECDKGRKWRLKRPLRFENVLEGVPRRLQPLFDRYGIRATYLLSPEILKDDACADAMRTLEGRAELGTHLHAEFIEPDPKPGADVTDAFQSEYPPEVERAKLRNLTRLFEARFGRAPTSFRAGRYAIGPHTLTFLEELGYAVDSSVTPHAWWLRRKNFGVNFMGAPDQPYHPSARDFRRRGAMRILEVPITLVNPFWERWPAALRRAVDPTRSWQSILLKALFRRRLRSTWLRPSLATADEMLAVTKHMDAKANGRPATLCMMFHSNEATRGTSPYNLTEREVEDFLDRLDRYFERLFESADVRSIGLSEVRA